MSGFLVWKYVVDDLKQNIIKAIKPICMPIIKLIDRYITK